MTKKKGVSFDGGPVGYKRPPAEHQFKKGKKPPGSGRKKGSKNSSTVAREVMEMPVPVTIDGKRKKMPAKEALLLRGMQQALTGSVSDVVRYYDLIGRLAPEETKEPLIVHFRPMPGDDW